MLWEILTFYEIMTILRSGNDIAWCSLRCLAGNVTLVRINRTKSIRSQINSIRLAFFCGRQIERNINDDSGRGGYE